MPNVISWVQCDADTPSETCSCCGREIVSGSGALVTEAGTQADYWFRYTEGHTNLFQIAVSLCDASGQPIGGVVVANAWVEKGNLAYGLVSPDDAPWKFPDPFAPILTREDARSQDWYPRLFPAVDAIAENDARLSARLLGAHDA